MSETAAGPMLDGMIGAHYARIHRAALALTGAPSEADDLAQETFLEAVRSVGRYAGRAGEYTWLYAILLNRHRRWRRQQRWKQQLAAVWARLRGTTVGPDTTGASRLREWGEGLWRHVAELPPRHGEVLVLRYAEGLSQEEIAAVLRCPVGTVKSRLHHAQAALRRRLAPDKDEWLSMTRELAGNPSWSCRLATEQNSESEEL